MAKNYGRLTRWILRTMPKYAALLTGDKNPADNIVTYKLREEWVGFRDLRLTAPLGVEIYRSINLGKIEGRDIFFATKPDDNNDAYLCSQRIEHLCDSLPKDRIVCLTDFLWYDEKVSSAALAFLVDSQSVVRSAPFPFRGLIKLQGLDKRLGYIAIKNTASGSRVFRYEINSHSV